MVAILSPGKAGGVGASVWVHPSIRLSVSPTVQATGNKKYVFTHCC